MMVRIGTRDAGAWLLAVAVSVTGTAGPALAQGAAAAPPTITSADYARAERFLATTVNP
ncbi:MAG: hypothetical protein IT181_27540, partial [Acidobacteria bacterium]|nr:hypothetical protein [Acidobacteriota bacterium]